MGERGSAPLAALSNVPSDTEVTSDDFGLLSLSWFQKAPSFPVLWGGLAQRAGPTSVCCECL
jgi:hypothetical protein